jgi:hypothetical protein
MDSNDGSSGRKAPGKSSKIYGSLGSVSLNDILQLLGMSRRTATVSIRHHDQHGEILFRDGTVLHAAAGSVIGEDALLRLVRWPEAEFVIDEGVRDAAPTTISKSVDAVMLDVLTRLDEASLDGGMVLTPATPMDKIDLPALENRVRSARPKPRPPAPRRGSKLVGVAAVALTVAVASAILFAWLEWGVDANGLPPFVGQAEAPSHIASPEIVAAEVVETTIAHGEVDTEELLGRRALSLGTPPAPMPESPSAQTPVEAPVAGEGRLLILAEPWGEVTLDGNLLGETPLPEMTLGAGEHEVVVSNPNAIGVIRDRVTVRVDETTSVRYSFGDTGRLKVVVTPWADVYVDGSHVGQTPLDELDVPVGRHEVTLRHPSLGEKTDNVVIRSGESTVLKVEM